MVLACTTVKTVQEAHSRAFLLNIQTLVRYNRQPFYGRANLMMCRCNAFFTGALLSLLACSTQAANLDLSYQEPPLADATAKAPEPIAPALKLPFKAPISVEYSCSGQCRYETDINQLHDRETRQTSRIGFD